MNFYQFLMPRLEGGEIENNLDKYLSLTRKGVAGFIVFGGEVSALREGIRRLQEAAALPLIISSDLEQGLGQQVKGGTVFPPAAAIARAERKSPGLARKVFECTARESAYVGINTIFAPVLDVNTNPANPIIATRAFSDEPDGVSALGALMIEAFTEHGIVPCGKHFPGHGDTSVDSHLSLPVVDKTIDELESCELRPFRAAVSAGVPMMMLGHLSVPAMDPSGNPVSISKPAIRFLKDELGFTGMVITDAMNMGGLGSFSEEEAALMALESGVDILLHPSEPDRIVAALEKSGRTLSADRLNAFRSSLPAIGRKGSPPPLCEDLMLKATREAITVEGTPSHLNNPFVLVITDEDDESGMPFVEALKERFPSLGHCRVSSNMPNIQGVIPDGSDLIVAIFTKVKAFKGGTAPWIIDLIRSLDGRAKAVVSFGNPLILSTPGIGVCKVFAWWDSRPAQLEAAKIFLI